jgi:hypothetical protein
MRNFTKMGYFVAALLLPGTASYHRFARRQDQAAEQPLKVLAFIYMLVVT